MATKTQEQTEDTTTQDAPQDATALLLESMTQLNTAMGEFNKRLTALEPGSEQSPQPAKRGRKVKATNDSRPIGGWDVDFRGVPATTQHTTPRGAAKVEHWTRMGRFTRLQRYEAEAVMPGNAEYCHNVMEHCFDAKGNLKDDVLKAKGKVKAS